MSIYILYFLAFIGGVSLSVQSGFNTQLGVLLKNPFLAALVASSLNTNLYGISMVIPFGYELDKINEKLRRDFDDVVAYID